MPKSYEDKKRQDKYSLNRRSRLRKAYFKLTGSEQPAVTLESKDLNIDEPDSEDEKDSGKPKDQAPQLTKKQLASRKRQLQYRKFKEAQEKREASEIKRKIQRKKATARTKKGQPKLGAQMGLLLDKIRESNQ